MSDCKKKYIEWSTDNGCYCGEYKQGNLKGLMCGNDARNEFDAWEACWSARQSEIDQLKAEKAGFKDLIKSLRSEFDLNGGSYQVERQIELLEEVVRGEHE